MKILITTAILLTLSVNTSAAQSINNSESNSGSTSTSNARATLDSKINVETGDTNVNVNEAVQIVNCETENCEAIRIAQLVPQLSALLLGVTGCENGAKIVRIRRAAESDLDWVCD
jgi:hypothetical protein